MSKIIIKISSYSLIILSLTVSQAWADYTWEKLAPKKTNSQLEYELRSSNNRIESLLLQIESLNTELEVYQLKERSNQESAKSESLLLKKKIKALTKEIQSLENQNNQLLLEKESDHGEINDFVNTIKSVESDNIQLDNTVSTLQDLLQQREEQLNIFQENITALKKQLDQVLKKSNTDFSNSQKTIDQQFSQIKSLKSEKIKALDNVNLIQDELVSIQNKFKNSQLKEQKYLVNINKLQQSTTEIKKELEQSNEHVNQTIQKFKTLEDENQKFKNQVNEVKLQHQQSINQVKALEPQVGLNKELQAEKQQFLLDIKKLEDRILANQGLSEKLTQSKLSYTKVNQTLENRQAQLMDIQKQLTQKNVMIEEIEQHNQGLQQKLDTIVEKHDSKIKQLTERLKKQILFSKKFQHEVNIMTQDIGVWQEKLRGSDQTIVDMKVALTEERKVRLSDKKALDDTTTKLKNNEYILDNYQEKNKNHQLELSILQNKLGKEKLLHEDTKNNLDIKALKFDGLTLSNQNLKHEVSTLKEEKNESQVVVNQLKSILNRNKEKIAQQEKVFNIYYLRLCGRFNDTAKTSQQIDCSRIFK